MAHTVAIVSPSLLGTLAAAEAACSFRSLRRRVRLNRTRTKALGPKMALLGRSCFYLRKSAEEGESGLYADIALKAVRDPLP